MTFHAIRYTDGHYQAYRTENGTGPGTNVGPKWTTPREASAFLASLSSIPATSPLRSRSEADSTEAVLGPATGDARPLNEADRHPLRSPHLESGASTPGSTPAAPGLWDAPGDRGG